MTFMKGEAKLMPSDARGSGRLPGERWGTLPDEFERIGLSGLKFPQLAAG